MSSTINIIIGVFLYYVSGFGLILGADTVSHFLRYAPAADMVQNALRVAVIGYVTLYNHKKGCAVECISAYTLTHVFVMLFSLGTLNMSHA